MPRDLEKYRAKRTADSTPEPAGSRLPGAGRALRGAPARGPEPSLGPPPGTGRGPALLGGPARAPRPIPPTSASPSRPRIIPIEYADFEGVIPAGNYGAGSMIVWDKGQVDPARGPARGPGEGQAPLRAQGLQAQGHVDPGEAQEGREGVAPDQGARRLRRKGRHVPAGVGAVGAVGGAPARQRGGGDVGDGRTRAAEAAEGRPQGRRHQADAVRERRPALQQGRLGVRAQARWLAGARGAAGHRGAAAFAQRQRPLGVLSRGACGRCAPCP